MGKKERMILVRDNLRKHFDLMSKLDLNMVKFNSGNTFEHEMKKAEIAFNCIKDGFTVIVEGITNKGYRPDVTILDLNIPICYEIAKSESDESLDNKEKNYKGMKVIRVKI